MSDVPLERVARLETRLTALERGDSANTVHRDNVERRLANIEDTLKWLVRLVMGGLILAILAFAVNGGFAGV
jgi:hypothetical protein